MTKHDLQVRPVYHWKPARIRAHVAIAFMCLTLVRMLGYRTKVQQRTRMSEARIRNALQKAEVAVPRRVVDDTRYGIPMPLTTDARKLYKLMHVDYRTRPFEIA